jgi:hypothetical protein
MQSGHTKLGQENKAGLTKKKNSFPKKNILYMTVQYRKPELYTNLGLREPKGTTNDDRHPAASTHLS